MVIKEKKLLLLSYLCRYGRISKDDADMICQRISDKDFRKLLEVPGIYLSVDGRTLYTLYFLMSHRINSFMDAKSNLLTLKTVGSISPIVKKIDYTSSDTIAKGYFP
jgi:hypothetical protein